MVNNIFVKRYRKILEDLSQNLRGKYETITRNNSMYSESVAQSYNAEIEKEIVSLINKAESKAHKVMMDVSLALNQWATVQGRCITKDADLLTSGAYPISADELNKLIDIYSGNYTMLSLIQKYSDEHKMNIYIIPVGKKLEVYEKFYNSCLSMIAQIARNHGVYDDSQWANNHLCLPLYDVIGTGAELQDFKMLRLEIQTPIKDFPSPVQEANFNFSFKPVNRNNQSVNLY